MTQTINNDRHLIEKRGLWFCPICKFHVYPNTKTGEPLSNYWNVELNSVYCSPEHALQHSEEMKAIKE